MTNKGVTQSDDMQRNLMTASADGGQVVQNIVRLARVLRAAGLPVGPDRTVLATESALSVGLERLGVFRAALEASFVSQPEHRVIFDQAFQLFWKEPNGTGSGAPPADGLEDGSTQDENQIARRLLESLLDDRKIDRPDDVEIDIDRSETFSSDELFRKKDFEQMSRDELFAARRALARIAVLNEEIVTRRFANAPAGARLDLRSMLRGMARRGPDYLDLAFRARVKRRAPLVVLIDISGSMEIYARMMLHFVYMLINGRGRAHAFLFGTRLTNVTRQLRGRDPDVAIAKVASEVEDWSGGTRIGESLDAFNRLWGRRVLGQNATVLLVTDGLDREAGAGIGEATRRLRASCRRLIWLNPLLRYDEYAPLASGARELVVHVSDMASCHNLNSMDQLALALNDGRRGGRGLVGTRVS